MRGNIELDPEKMDSEKMDSEKMDPFAAFAAEDTRVGSDLWSLQSLLTDVTGEAEGFTCSRGSAERGGQSPV